MCAILLRKSPTKKFVFFRWFNNTLGFLTKGYLVGVSRLLRVSLLVLLVWGGLIATAEGATTRAGVFAGGDAVTGAATVILAMGAGRTAAKAIDEYLTRKK